MKCTWWGGVNEENVVRVNNEHETDVKKGTPHIEQWGNYANVYNARIIDKVRRENKRYNLESLRMQGRIQISMNTKINIKQSCNILLP